MKIIEHTTTRVRRKPSEQDVISKLLSLLTHYKTDPLSLKKAFRYVRRLKTYKDLSLSPELQAELQELEALEETFATGKITIDNQHIITIAVKDSIDILKECERSVRKNKA